jgi:hypothetical protein
MKSKILKYVRGEDEFACECFEPLWQRVLSEYHPKKTLALILPCTFGKPYIESYLTQTILSSLLAATDKFFEGEKFSAVRDFLSGLEHKDVLDVIDIWHMSSCGFVPPDWEIADDGEYSFGAYDWDSARASEEDVASWYTAALRRTEEWMSTFEPRYEKILVYLRNGSKSQEVVSPYFRNEKVVSAFLPAIEDETAFTMRRWMTLNSRREEVDLPLITGVSIAFLALQIAQALENLVKNPMTPHKYED